MRLLNVIDVRKVVFDIREIESGFGAWFDNCSDEASNLFEMYIDYLIENQLYVYFYIIVYAIAYYRFLIVIGA